MMVLSISMMVCSWPLLATRATYRGVQNQMHMCSRSTWLRRCNRLRLRFGLGPDDLSGRPITSDSVGDLKQIPEGPSLRDFLKQEALQTNKYVGINNNNRRETSVEMEPDEIPYLLTTSGDGRKVYFETYGCQMNVSDMEIVWSILKKNNFSKVDNVKKADVILLMTCAIRENAETKIWNRLQHFRSLKESRRRKDMPVKIGLLGCMAERLKKKILDKSKLVDVIAGPDAYRDLPRLLDVSTSGNAAINTILSIDETYADVMPVRLNHKSPTAYVSIMRGCDNMCSYCIVPFTRGRERSRPITSILEEIRILSAQGVKEVTLLGQNVNSYRDVSEDVYYSSANEPASDNVTAKGFSTIYKPKLGGLRFADLLDKVSQVDENMRIRFTSPHPKDFPDQVLEVIRDRPNICNHLHLPAQSGNSDVLHRMRRGYTREAYLELVDHVRNVLPNVSLTSDFITGFCGETEQEHEDTLSLLQQVDYNYTFLFAYSMRQKTHAYHKMKDDVPEEVKKRRLDEMITIARESMTKVNEGYVGKEMLVLVEGKSRRSDDYLAGRIDANTKVIISDKMIPEFRGSSHLQPINIGDFIAVQITDSNSQVLKGTAAYHSSCSTFSTTDSERQCMLGH
ncbi:CDK5RAP1-like protein [Anneissia japonica]|uniref:CDK5RAP1-like protein n=1 Tax=Anneissia japonica TaxID=1529436 RepID=UPI0014255A55|nr:CDK5RAP1-like protein [Anneissia japonica]